MTALGEEETMKSSWEESLTRLKKFKGIALSHGNLQKILKEDVFLTTTTSYLSHHRGQIWLTTSDKMSNFLTLGWGVLIVVIVNFEFE